MVFKILIKRVYDLDSMTGVIEKYFTCNHAFLDTTIFIFPAFMEVEDQNFSSHINNNINNNITNADKDAIRLWRVWKTVHQLCRDRGYTVNPEDTNISLQDFCAVYAVSGSVVKYFKNIFPTLISSKYFLVALH